VAASICPRLPVKLMRHCLYVRTATSALKITTSSEECRVDQVSGKRQSGWIAPALRRRRPPRGKSGISADMAIRLDKAFGCGAETWLRLQMAYELAQARQREREVNIKPVTRRKLHESHP
jgi:hypothetical protein